MVWGNPRELSPYQPYHVFHFVLPLLSSWFDSVSEIQDSTATPYIPVPRSPRFWGDMTPGPRSQDVPWLNGFGRAAGSSAPSGFCGSAPRQGSAPSNHQGRRGSGRRRHAPCAAGRDPAVSHGISISGSRMLEGRLWSASVSYLFQFDPLYPLFDFCKEPHTLKLGISC